MAEAILRHVAGDRFEALSAGSFPSGYIHPLAVEAVQRLGATTEGQRSKSWDEVRGEELDAVITLCDHAAGASCPAWPGDPLRAHWSLSDPVSFLGTEEEQRAFGERIARRLQEKIKALVALDWTCDRAALGRRLELLGDI